MFLREILNKYGYKNGVSTILGMAKNGNNKFFLKRIPMNSCDDPELLRAKIEGGYDWMHTVQYTAKSLRAMVGLRRRKSLAKWTSQ